MSAPLAQSILEAACKELACQPKEFIQSGKEDSHPQPDQPEPALRKRKAEALGANSAAELLTLHFPGFLDARSASFACLVAKRFPSHPYYSYAIW